ncbi:MAG: hypothetical protein AAFP99_09925 [Pseudomonadota bacterium]
MVIGGGAVINQFGVGGVLSFLLKDSARNLFFVLFGFAAFAIALWRGWIANRERRNAEARWLLQRFYDGIEMTTALSPAGQPHVNRRLAGVAYLEELFDELKNPKYGGEYDGLANATIDAIINAEA